MCKIQQNKIFHLFYSNLENRRGMLHKTRQNTKTKQQQQNTQTN